MAKPLTREIAGLVWTYDRHEMEWRTPCGLRAWKCLDNKFCADLANTFHPTLTAACKAEAAHRAATKASPTLDPGELDQMLGELSPAPAPDVAAHAEAERAAQRADDLAYYRRAGEWALAVLLLAGLVCAGVWRG